jgi:hypothetical protein
MAEMRLEMRIFNPLVFCRVLIVMLFLLRVIVMLVSVLVLGVYGHRTTQKECSA